MTSIMQSAPSASRRTVLARRIRLFAAATITYNVVEAAAALWAGSVADSSALIGFGLDSVIEVASALALSWQFSAKDPERREQLTLRIIAVSFFALAAFVAVDAVRSLFGAGEPRHSPIGIVIAALSLAIMPVLSWLQRRAGRELGSRTAVADSKQTLLCTYLSAVLLAGLLLNSTMGWWWADAGAALVIAAIAVREGINAWNGEACCVVPHAAESDELETGDCCIGCRTDPDVTQRSALSFGLSAAPSSGAGVDFELLSIPGCPNTAAARDAFARALALEGIAETVHLREVASDAEAEALGFRGSPTFRAADRDLFPGTGSAALSCRLYRHGHGLSGVPSLDDLRAALRATLAADSEALHEMGPGRTGSQQ